MRGADGDRSAEIGIGPGICSQAGQGFVAGHRDAQDGRDRGLALGAAVHPRVHLVAAGRAQQQCVGAAHIGVAADQGIGVGDGHIERKGRAHARGGGLGVLLARSGDRGGDEVLGLDAHVTARHGDRCVGLQFGGGAGDHHAQGQGAGHAGVAAAGAGDGFHGVTTRVVLRDQAVTRTAGGREVDGVVAVLGVFGAGVQLEAAVLAHAHVIGVGFVQAAQRGAGFTLFIFDGVTRLQAVATGQQIDLLVAVVHVVRGKTQAALARQRVHVQGIGRDARATHPGPGVDHVHAHGGRDAHCGGIAATDHGGAAVGQGLGYADVARLDVQQAGREHGARAVHDGLGAVLQHAHRHGGAQREVATAGSGVVVLERLLRFVVGRVARAAAIRGATFGGLGHGGHRVLGQRRHTQAAGLHVGAAADGRFGAARDHGQTQRRARTGATAFGRAVGHGDAQGAVVGHQLQGTRHVELGGAAHAHGCVVDHHHGDHGRIGAGVALAGQRGQRGHGLHVRTRRDRHGGARRDVGPVADIDLGRGLGADHGKLEGADAQAVVAQREVGDGAQRDVVGGIERAVDVQVGTGEGQEVFIQAQVGWQARAHTLDFEFDVLGAQVDRARHADVGVGAHADAEVDVGRTGQDELVAQQVLPAAGELDAQRVTGTEQGIEVGVEAVEVEGDAVLQAGLHHGATQGGDADVGVPRTEVGAPGTEAQVDATGLGQSDLDVAAIVVGVQGVGIAAGPGRVADVGREQQARLDRLHRKRRASGGRAPWVSRFVRGRGQGRGRPAEGLVQHTRKPRRHQCMG